MEVLVIIPINRVERDGRYRLPLVTLADGRPAWERGGFVTQRMIDTHGSYQAAREAYGRANA
jgi:hypothetical protein